MVDTSVQTEKLTIDEFMRLYETEGPFEIIDGERVEKVPPLYMHVQIAHALLKALILFLENHPLGEASLETAFVLPDTDKSNWVRGSRIPDLMFIRSDRLATYTAETEDYQNLPLMLVPDLTVEIVSPTDSYQDVERKVDLYLEDGVQQVWVIKPKTQTISIYEGTERRNLTKGDTLSGEDIIPGFEMPVASLFEGINQ